MLGILISPVVLAYFVAPGVSFLAVDPGHAFVNRFQDGRLGVEGVAAQAAIVGDDQQGHPKLGAMALQQRRAMAVRVRKAIDKDLASLRQMRETAVGEKATGTVAEIDKAIAAKEEQSKRLASLVQKPKAGRKEEAAKGDQSQGKATAGHKKHRKSGK